MRTLLRIGPFLLLAAVATGLALDRSALHAPRSAAVPLATGLVAVTWLALLRRFTLANAPPVPAPSRARPLVSAVLTSAQWFVALLFGLAAIPRQGPGLVLAGAGLGCLFLPAAIIAVHAGKPPPPEPPRPEPAGGWLLVARPGGTGYAIRWAHPSAWKVVALLVAGPLLILAVARAGSAP